MGIENKLEYAQTCSQELDKILVHDAKTGFMAQNNFGVSFTGTNSVKVPSMTLTGAGDYDKKAGYPKSAITVSREPYTLAQDRGVSFELDAVDADEIGVNQAISNVAGNFVREKMIPETDAYAISKLAGIAIQNSQTISAANYADKPYEAFCTLEDKLFQAGVDQEIVVICSRDFYRSLKLSKEAEKIIDAGSFKHGEISLEVKKIDEISLIIVPDSRLYTAYEFLAGESEEDFGFKPLETAKRIKALMLPKKAPCRINKHEKLRIFNPEENKDKDAYVVNYRLYYDVLVKKSMVPALWAMIED